MSLSGVRTFTFSQSSRSTLGGSDSSSRSSTLSVDKRNGKEDTWSVSLDGGSRSGEKSMSRISDEDKKNASVAIDFQAVKTSFQELKPYAKAQKNNLPQKILSKLLALLKLAKRIVHTEDYAEFMRLAEETFGDTSQAERGSVGHFFRAWALEVSVEKGFDIACSIDRAGALPSPHDKEAGHCSSYVGLLDDTSSGGFTIHYTPPKHVDSLYIHLSKPAEDLGGHYEEVAAQMKQYNLTKYTLVYPNEEGRSTVGKTFYLPNSKGKGIRTNDAINVGSNKQVRPVMDSDPAVSEDSTWSAWTVIIVLVLVIFFIVAIALCFMTDDDYTDRPDSSYTPHSSTPQYVSSGGGYETVVM